MPISVLGYSAIEDYDFNNITAKTTLNKDKYEQAKREFEALDFDFRCTLDRLTMVKVNREFTQCDDIEVFEL
jgi:L-rhamnose isomerase